MSNGRDHASFRGQCGRIGCLSFALPQHTVHSKKKRNHLTRVFAEWIGLTGIETFSPHFFSSCRTLYRRLAINLILPEQR